MERHEIEQLMKDVYTSSEAAEYLNISVQRLNRLVHDKKIVPIKANKSITLFLKSDLEKWHIVSFSANNDKQTNNASFNIDIPYVRDAILYYTIQQYFNNSDKKTKKFIDMITASYDFDYRSTLQVNIPLLARLLNTTKNGFYQEYGRVKNSFLQLSDEVILSKKGDEVYSKLLASTEDAPPYLFLKGDVNLLNEKSVCVVGSRNASNEGMKRTEKLVKSLIHRNIVVNAGLAKGIDTATHKTALKNNGKTIAVIGTPINRYYPKENKELQLQIEEKGLVVSQFPPCNETFRWNFPLRNATMSGISLATIIMEAGETSGALKQADYALKQSRDVLIPKSAIDNPVIRWPRKYIDRGAKPFSTLREALEILNANQVLKGVFKISDLEEVKDVEMD
ncbi:DNA-protecting protein DprA [Faecalicoccus pleomorphus]|uniref:DNA-protecting protein DprA n=1 Tax=Faecalicoccus pleomorphus TaxID=1323 RepID=UPI00196170EA|nr:DNA-protecting protein DprA [Faecalicoccus pleomorphus]MBM6765753.1 DNA-protecting protein DprA [Faecalicoccus pleomorphus]MDM8291994.1 DNA-protecting protein DprA [Faecalicoccus pleomorphus]